MSSNHRLTGLLEAGVFAALAMALSFIPDVFSWFSPSWGTLPILILALRRGPRYGFLAGLLWGLLHFLLGKVYYLSLPQVVIEYLLAFMSLGLAGYFAPAFQKALAVGKRRSAWFWAMLAASLAILVRYAWHFLAGVIFWSQYAGKLSPVVYSLLVNGLAGLGTWLVCLLVLGIFLRLYPQFLKK